MSKTDRAIGMDQLYGNDRKHLLGEVAIEFSPLHLAGKTRNVLTEDAKFTALKGAIIAKDDRKLSLELGEVAELTDNAKEILLNSSDAFGNSLMHHAAVKDNMDACELLFSQGAMVDAKNNEGSTPLHLAIRYNNPEIAKWLMENGAHVETPNNHSALPLHVSTELGLSDLSFTILSYMKGSLNATDKYGNTFLHYAALTEDLELCNKLLLSGARIDLQNVQGATPVHLAACHFSRTVMEILLSKEFFSEGEIRNLANLRMRDGRTALHIACRAGSPDIVRLLLDLGVSYEDDDVTSPLHVAAVSGVSAIAQLLLDNNMAVDLKDGQGQTALHYAAMFGKDRFCLVLLEHGASIDVQDNFGSTPLLKAVTKGHHFTVQVLLEKGANVTVGNQELRTCLHIAVMNEDSKMVDILLPQRCFIVGLRDSNLQTPLHYAAFVGNEVVLKLLLKSYLSVADVDANGRNALHIAAQNGHEDAVRLLTVGAHSGDVDCKDDNLMTPLHLAAIKGHVNVCALLIKMKAFINCKDATGRTPLHYAVSHNHDNIAKILLDQGASVDVADNNEFTPLYLAVKFENLASLKLLLDYNAKLCRRVGDEDRSILSEAVDLKLTDMGMAIVSHERWSKAKQCDLVWNSEIMKKLVISSPEIAEIVMYDAIEYSDESPDKDDLTVTYHFDVLESPLEDQVRGHARRILPARKEVQTDVLQHMVKYQRTNLLEHPLISAYLLTKWNSFAGRMFLLSALMYLFFLSSTTAMVLMVRKVSEQEEENAANITTGTRSPINDPREKGYGKLLATVALAFSVAMIAGHFGKVYVQRAQYFSHFRNWLECTLFVIAVLYMILFLFQPGLLSMYSKDQIGALLIFLAWCNLLRYLQNLRGFRLFIIMFVEVLLTLLKVVFIFSAIIVAFALTHFQLFRNQATYMNFGRSVVKTLSMAVDGTDYDNVVISNLETRNTENGLKMVPFPRISITLMFIFMLVISIALMNLLVGLAVGDIDSIRRAATLRSIEQQIEFVTNVQTNIPRFIYKRLYKKEGVFTPNRKTRFERFINSVLPIDLRWESMDHKALLLQRQKDKQLTENEEKKDKSSTRELIEELRSLRKRLDEQDQLIRDGMNVKTLPTPPVYFGTAIQM